MKLLYVLGSYFPAQSGGPNNTIHWQAKYLNKSNVDVSVVSLKSGLTDKLINRYRIKLNKKNSVEGVSAYYFDFLKNRYLSFKLYFWLIKNINKYDFVQLTSYFFPITWFSALLCKIHNIPFSIAPRGELEDNALKYSNTIKNIIDKILLKKLYEKASFVMVTSLQEKEFCKSFFNKDMNYELVPNYIDLSKNKIISNSEIKDKKDILYLGRLHPKKGIENLIKAYFLLDKNYTDNHYLYIVGTGNKEYEKKLHDLVNENMFNDRIKFLGHKDGIEKENLYKRSKVFVLPSFSENFGNVVLEALSNFTPVLASNFTPWNNLESNKCGFCIENKPSEIKKYLEKILNFSELEYIEIAKNSNKFAFSYDMKTNVDKLTNIYSKYAK